MQMVYLTCILFKLVMWLSLLSVVPSFICGSPSLSPGSQQSPAPCGSHRAAPQCQCQRGRGGGADELCPPRGTHRGNPVRETPGKL